MDTAFITHLLSSLLMIGLPVALGIFLTRRFGLGWRLWWIGAAGFVLSQVGHVPFNWLVTRMFQVGILPPLPPAWVPFFNPIFLGLSAGLWEELTRAGIFKWWADDARSWRKGVLLGAGHGGSEAILLGLQALYGFAVMVAYRDMDMTTVVPPEQVALARQQVAAYWAAGWALNLLPALERLLTLVVQISFAVLVLQAFTRRQPVWIVLAVLWHAVVDGVMVYFSIQWAAQPYRYWAVEGLIAVSALLSLGIIFALRRPDPPEPSLEAAPEPLPPVVGIKPEDVQLEVTKENLDNSKYFS